MSRSRHAVAGLAALGLVLGAAGCRSDEETHAARVAHEALGIQQKKSTTETKPRKLVVRNTEQVIDPATREVLKETVTETPVTVQVEVERQVKTDVGEARTAATEP